MRFGINTFLFTSPFTNESTKLFKQFKKWGFDTVEIPVEDPAHIDPAHVKRELDNHGLEMIRDVGNPALRLHLDTFHMNIEEKDSAAAIRKAGKTLGHFHACGSDRGTPGKDSIDWPSIAKALKKIGYDADVVIESFTTDVKVIARAAAIWRRIEPTRDEIAVKGIKFLRKTLGLKSPSECRSPEWIPSLFAPAP